MSKTYSSADLWDDGHAPESREPDGLATTFEELADQQRAFLEQLAAEPSLFSLLARIERLEAAVARLERNMPARPAGWGR